MGKSVQLKHTNVMRAMLKRFVRSSHYFGYTHCTSQRQVVSKVRTRGSIWRSHTFLSSKRQGQQQSESQTKVQLGAQYHMNTIEENHDVSSIVNNNVGYFVLKQMKIKELR